MTKRPNRPCRSPSCTFDSASQMNLIYNGKKKKGWKIIYTTILYTLLFVYYCFLSNFLFTLKNLLYILIKIINEYRNEWTETVLRPKKMCLSKIVLLNICSIYIWRNDQRFYFIRNLWKQNYKNCLIWFAKKHGSKGKPLLPEQQLKPNCSLILTAFCCPFFPPVSKIKKNTSFSYEILSRTDWKSSTIL